MILIVTEKNDAAQQIARLLSESGKPEADKVYNTPVYRFRKGGEEYVTIGLRGHILQPDFPTQLLFDADEGWYGATEDGEHIPADVPDGLARPPYKEKRKPYLKAGIDLKGWKIPSLPYLIWAPVEKEPAEKEIIRSLKNLAKNPMPSSLLRTLTAKESSLAPMHWLRYFQSKPIFLFLVHGIPHLPNMR